MIRKMHILKYWTRRFIQFNIKSNYYHLFSMTATNRFSSFPPAEEDFVMEMCVVLTTIQYPSPDRVHTFFPFQCAFTPNWKLCNQIVCVKFTTFPCRTFFMPSEQSYSLTFYIWPLSWLITRNSRNCKFHIDNLINLLLSSKASGMKLCYVVIYFLFMPLNSIPFIKSKLWNRNKNRTNYDRIKNQ